jgi:cyclic beta-1,2-glucan synthetase
VWSESEKKFICRERKRGKLEEFNRWLRGAQDTSFFFVYGDRTELSRARYVITLDLDTQLPPGTAWKLIGTIDYPLHTR